MTSSTNMPYRLYAWNFSYFSAKIRAYLRFKEFNGALCYEEVLASQEIIQGLMIPATGSNVVPQIQKPNGDWVQDSSEIIDVIEAAHPDSPVVPQSPKQKLVSYLIEFLADEWMLPWGFWERWHYTQKHVSPNHRDFNAFQWGRIFNPNGSGSERLAAGHFIFDEVMKVDKPEEAQTGPFVGLPQLGITSKTESAWTNSTHNILSILEKHFDLYDYILGGQPSLADFALIGPLYPHLYKDPVPGFMMRTQYPMVCEWIERVNGSKEAGSNSYQEPRYDLVDGKLIAKASGVILPNDEIPETLMSLLHVVFDEMWPMLKTNVATVTNYITASTDKTLPGKSFHSSAEFRSQQSSDGSLTLTFEIGGIEERRMASPYQVWMLERMNDAIREDGPKIRSFLGNFNGGSDLLELDDLLANCKIEKHFENLTSVPR